MTIEDRATLEARALRAVALGLPEARTLSDALGGEHRQGASSDADHVVEPPRARLERRALSAVALGRPDADELIRALEAS